MLCLGTAVAMAVSGRDDVDSSEVVAAVSKHSNSEPGQSSGNLNLDLSAIKRTVPEKIHSAGLFQSKSWYTPPPPPPVTALPPPQPVAPTLSFKYIGKMIDGNEVVLFLTKNGRQYTAKVNDVLDENYKVEKITDSMAVLTYLPMNIQQTLAFNSSASNASPAMPNQPVGAMASATFPAPSALIPVPASQQQEVAAP